jgi:hypothetical protein
MKIAMLYASWEKFGEPWNTPAGIRNELESRGHEIRHYNLYHDDGLMFRDNMRHYSNQGINKLMEDVRLEIFRPDAIFCMDYGPWDAVQFDKKYFPGVVLLSEAGDEPQSHRMHMPKASRVHFVLSPDRECVERYNTCGFNAVYWTHHADTKMFYPRSDIDVEFDCVTTCGSRGAGLTDEIKNALGDSFNNERYFYGEDHAKRLNMGKIVFQCSQFKEVTRRIFEGMACGKMVITDRLPDETGLSEMFIEGRDIIYYDDALDAISKIRYYADNHQERERIALNGYNKVINEHDQRNRCDIIETCIKEAKETMLV